MITFIIKLVNVIIIDSTTIDHFQVMSNIPLKVKTKMMAFDDSTATAPDRLTGEKNIVAFRACGLKITDRNYNHSPSTPGISMILYFLLSIHNIFPVPWGAMDYSIGNYFDGTIFTAPKTGLYTFFAQFGCAANHRSYASFYVNAMQKIASQWAMKTDALIVCTLQATLKLAKGDKVEVRLYDGLYTPSENECYFEGRLISLIAD